MPARRQGSRLGFAVAHHAAHQEVRLVERGAIGVRQRIAELAAFVDRARYLRRDVTADPARKRERAKQLPHASRVLRGVRIALAPDALEPRVGDRRRTAVARTDDEDRVPVALANHAIHVRDDQVEPRRGAPVPEQSRLHVLDAERLAKQRVLEQVDLPDRQVVRRPPVGVDRVEHVGCGASRGGGHRALRTKYPLSGGDSATAPSASGSRHGSRDRLDAAAEAA